MAETSSGLWYAGPKWQEKLPKAVIIPIYEVPVVPMKSEPEKPKIFFPPGVRIEFVESDTPVIEDQAQ